MAKKTGRCPALYERLSHDDGLQGESSSISNQKRILEEYANRDNNGKRSEAVKARGLGKS